MRALKAIIKAIKNLGTRLDAALENQMEKIMSSCRSHEEEIEANKTPLSKEIYERTKGVIVWRDTPGAGFDAVDQEATRIARAKIEKQVRREFAKA